MVEIKIEGKVYEVITSIEDMNFGDWITTIDIISRREYKELEMASGEIVKEEIEKEKESQEFKEDKRLDLLAHLSLVPKEMLIEYPSLPDIIEELIQWDKLLDDKTTTEDEIIVCGLKYSVIRPSKSIFQQWCDSENFLKINRAAMLIPFLSNGDYNRFHPDFDTRLELLLRSPAVGLVSLYESISEEMYQIRDSYKFVYSNEDIGGVDPVGINTEEHFKRFNWEDVIISTAEAQVFNSPKGSLWAVRNEQTLEVLDYLNVKKSKSIAELKDSIAAKHKSKY